MGQSHAIRDSRARLRMTQASLAKAAGMSLNTVKRAEAGLPVQDESIRSICAVLGLDVVDFPRSSPSDGPPPALQAAPAGANGPHAGPSTISEWALFKERCREWDPSPEVRLLIALGLVACLVLTLFIDRALTYLWGLSPSLSAPPPVIGWLDPGAVNFAFSRTMLFALMVFVSWSSVGMVVCDLTGKEHPLSDCDENSHGVPASCAACFLMLVPLEGNWGIFQQIALTLTGIVLGTESLSWTVGLFLLIGQIALLLRVARYCQPLFQGPPLAPLGLAMGFMLLAPANGFPLSQVIASVLVFACAAAMRHPSPWKGLSLRRVECQTS